MSCLSSSRAERRLFFHLASKISLTLRVSLLIREFAAFPDPRCRPRVGRLIPWDELSTHADRKDLLARLFGAVFSIGAWRAQSFGAQPNQSQLEGQD